MTTTPWRYFHLILFALFLAGCGDSRDYVHNGGHDVTPKATRRVTVISQQVEARAADPTVAKLAFSGLDRAGVPVYGPEVKARAADLVLDVPISTVEFRIAYLDANNAIVGVYQQDLPPGTSSVTITDPDYIDAPGFVQSIAVDSAAFSIPVGGDERLTVTALLSDNTSRDVTGDVVLLSSDPAIAMLSGNNVTGLAIGASTMTATLFNKSDSASVTVVGATQATLAITAPSTSLFVNGAQQLEATRVRGSSSTTVTGSVTWSSSNGAVANVTTTGLVTGLSVGTADISAADAVSGQNATITVSVSADPNSVAPPVDEGTPGDGGHPLPPSNGITGVRLDLSALSLPTAADQIRVRALDGSTEVFRADYPVSSQIYTVAIAGQPDHLIVELLHDGLAFRATSEPVTLRPNQLVDVLVDGKFARLDEASLQGEYFMAGTIGSTLTPTDDSPASTAGFALKGWLEFDGLGHLTPGTVVDVLIPNPDFAYDSNLYPAAVKPLEVVGGTYDIDEANLLVLTLDLEGGARYEIQGSVSADSAFPAVRAAGELSDARDLLPSALCSARILHNGVSGFVTAVQPATNVSSDALVNSRHTTFGTSVSAGTVGGGNQWNFESNTVFGDDGAGLIGVSGRFLPGSGPDGNLTYKLTSDGRFSFQVPAEFMEELATYPDGAPMEMEGVLGRNGLLLTAGKFDGAGMVLVAQTLRVAPIPAGTVLAGVYHMVQWQNDSGLRSSGIAQQISFDEAGNGTFPPFVVATELSPSRQFFQFFEPLIGRLYFTADRTYGVKRRAYENTLLGLRMFVAPPAADSE